jgi:hypothetical protein
VLLRLFFLYFVLDAKQNMKTMNNFEKVKGFLLELGYTITNEDPDEELVIVEKPDAGINTLLIDCEDPILVIEYPILKLKAQSEGLFKELLVKNRDIVHGAFALTDDGTLIFRDTLQLENLDMNEIEGTLNSLELLLAEYSYRLIEISKN